MRATFRRVARTGKRAVRWCFGAGLLTGLLVLGVLGDPPYSVIRIGPALALAAALAFFLAQTFDDGSATMRSRYVAALVGTLLPPMLSLGVDWG